MNKTLIIDSDRIEIQSSKRKLFFLLLGSTLFVLGGFYFIHSPSEFRGPEWEILIIGYASVIFFGFCGVGVFLQLFNSKPSLVIDDSGITMSGILFTSFVTWNMIKKFSIINVSTTKLVAVYLKKPNEYIKSLENPMARKLAQFSLKSAGTPLSISTNTLKCDDYELLALLEKKLKSKSEIEYPKSDITNAFQT